MPVDCILRLRKVTFKRKPITNIIGIGVTHLRLTFRIWTCFSIEVIYLIASISEYF